MGHTRSKVRKFQRNLHVAWMDDGEGGYRDATRQMWKIRPIKEVAVDHEFGQRVDMTALVGCAEAMPRVIVEPCRQRRLRIWSTINLIVQDLGEVAARLGGSSEEVIPGSVVRAGTVVVAVLTADQAEAVLSRRLLLPCPPTDHAIVAENSPESDLDLPSHIIDRRLRIWNICFAVAMVAATVCAGWVAIACHISLKGTGGGPPVNSLGGLIIVVAFAWVAVTAVALPLRGLVQLPSRPVRN